MLPTIPFLFGALGVFRRSRQRAVRLTVFLDQVLPVFSNDFFEGRIVGERPDAAPVSASSPHPLIENALTSPRRRSSTISLSSRETSGISRRHARPGVWNYRRPPSLTTGATATSVPSISRLMAFITPVSSLTNSCPKKPGAAHTGQNQCRHKRSMRIRNNIRVDRDRPGAHSIAGSYCFNEKWGCAFPLNKKPELDRAGSAELPCGKIRGSFRIAQDFGSRCPGQERHPAWTGVYRGPGRHAKPCSPSDYAEEHLRKHRLIPRNH